MATAEPPKPSWGCRYENVALGEEKKIKWQNNISVSESHISRLNNQTRHTTTSVFKVLWNQELCSWFFTRLWHQEMSSGQWLPVKPGDGFWNTCRVVGIKNNLQITIIYILTQHFLNNVFTICLPQLSSVILKTPILKQSWRLIQSQLLMVPCFALLSLIYKKHIKVERSLLQAKVRLRGNVQVFYSMNWEEESAVNGLPTWLSGLHLITIK